MTETRITNELKTHLIRQMIESVSEPANTLYYGFVSKHTEYENGDSSVPTISPSLKDTTIDPYRNMIFGKKINSSDMSIMVKRNNWTSGTTYAIYDHRDTELFDKEFFVVVDEGSYHHVWKCLNNNSNSASNVQPTFADAVSDSNLFANSDTYYETSDGYQWKYMYSVDDVTFEKFSSTTYMPVVANNDVVALAVDGSIDVIKVESGGLLYNNYTNGSFTGSDITIGGNNLVYALESYANTQTGFYSNTFIYLTAGTGKGQYRKVANSYQTNTNVVIVIETQFTTKPDATTTYEISPIVEVLSDGTQTVNCEARALVNSSSSNSVYAVEILERGAGYSFATANVLTGTAGNLVTNAEVSPIISPVGGHGFDAAEELGASHLGFSITFANTESGKISAENDFRQFGIIKDISFANLEILTTKISDGSDGYDGTFIAGETIHQFTKKRIYGNVTTESGNTTITANDTDAEWDEYFSSDEFLYLTDNAENLHFISAVNSVTNSTSLVFDKNVPWTSTNAEIYSVKITANAVIGVVVNDGVYVNQTNNIFILNRSIIGANSYAIGNVSVLDINNRYSNNATFSTFNQLTRFSGTTGTGVFEEDELVYQLNDSGTEMIATAYLHSIEDSGGTTDMYVTQVNGVFTSSKQIFGDESSATMTLLNKYSGDVEINSGEVLYIQNDTPVSRANNTSETVRIILEF